MKNFKFIALLMMFIVNSAFADKMTDTIAEKLKKLAPNAAADNIKKSNVPNMYEVIEGSDVIYVSQDGKYLFVGNVIDLDTQKNLTEDVKQGIRKDILKNIAISDMIIFKPKDKTKYALTVFTDIDCGYCRKLHSDIQKYTDQGVEVRYLPFPRAGAGSDSYKKAVTVWCAKDRNKALTDAKLNPDFKIAKKLCKNNPLEKSIELVRKLGLNGTPAIITEEGTLLPGYVPPASIISVLDKAKEQSSKKS